MGKFSKVTIAPVRVTIAPTRVTIAPARVTIAPARVTMPSTRVTPMGQWVTMGGPGSTVITLFVTKQLAVIASFHTRPAFQKKT